MSHPRWLRCAAGLLLPALALALAALPAPGPASAGAVDERLIDPFSIGMRFQAHTGQFGTWAAPGDTYALNNFGMTLEPGEQTEGGLLTRSIWGHLTPTQPSRVVIHTIGSDIDTVLAVYTGPAVNALTRVAGSHGVAVPGLAGPLGGLAQIDAAPGVAHHVQVGSLALQQADLAVNVFQFGPAGGLSAFLAALNDTLPVNGKDYVCVTTLCLSPTFLLHNSTDQTLEVVPASSFGALFTLPPVISLAPGAVATAKFTAVANTDLQTRTLTGAFTFSGRVNGAEVSWAQHPGTILVRGLAAETTLQAAALPTSRAGGVDQPLTAFATIINAGSQPAIGCVVRSQPFSRFRVSFQETDPATNTPIGQPNAPVNIPAGGARSFLFSVTSQGSLLGDPTTSGPVQFQCANAFPAAENLANSFALTALGTVAVADMISIGATATGDGTVNVVPGTGGAFAVATVNIGATATLTARPLYAHPFGEDDPAKQFLAFICETDASSGACLQPPAASVSFTAAPNVPRTFAVFLQRPAVDPGFDPGQRRVFVKFEQLSPPNFFGQNPIPLLTGSTSVAVRAR